jgi:hypothetical protein
MQISRTWDIFELWDIASIPGHSVSTCGLRCRIPFLAVVACTATPCTSRRTPLSPTLLSTCNVVQSCTQLPIQTELPFLVPVNTFQNDQRIYSGVVQSCSLLTGRIRITFPLPIRHRLTTTVFMSRGCCLLKPLDPQAIDLYSIQRRSTNMHWSAVCSSRNVLVYALVKIFQKSSFTLGETSRRILWCYEGKHCANSRSLRFWRIDLSILDIDFRISPVYYNFSRGLFSRRWQLKLILFIPRVYKWSSGRTCLRKTSIFKQYKLKWRVIYINWWDLSKPK